MSRLEQLARRPTGASNSLLLGVGGAPPFASARDPDVEVCDLCAEPVPSEHRHLVDVEERRLMCACRACTIVMGREGAGGARFRLVPERVQKLDGFSLDDALWDELRIPVDMAFFFRSTPAGRVVALYPGPMGATESLLGLEAWEELERANPALRDLEPDVEALLVNRARGAREHFVAPIDACYRLVGIIRGSWRGFGGGEDVWREIHRFFAELREEAM